MSLYNLGLLYFDMGDYKAAEPYFKKALEIYRKALGDEHPSCASCLNNLGALCKVIRDYKAAESYYHQALEIYKKAMVEERPDYAMSLKSIGNLYFRKEIAKQPSPIISTLLRFLGRL